MREQMAENRPTRKDVVILVVLFLSALVLLELMTK